MGLVKKNRNKKKFPCPATLMLIPPPRREAHTLILGTHDNVTLHGKVQSLSPVRLFATPRIAARQASLFIANFQSLLKLMSIELVMTSNHLILCHSLLLLPSVFPSIRVFSNESVLRTQQMWLT